MLTRALEPPVQGWLARQGLGRIVRAETLAGGYSNDNVLLVSESGERFVLRRYLRRNTCAVELAVLRQARDTVPVPEVVAADPVGDQAGRPVLLSRFVTGRPLSAALEVMPIRQQSPLLPDRKRADREHADRERAGRRQGGRRQGDGEQAGGSATAWYVTTGRHVGETLAAIGRITFPYPGFFDRSLRPSGVEPTAGLGAYVEQRLDSGALTAAEQDGLRRLAEEYEPLLATVAGERRLVHADFNPKNILVGDDGTVAAVLDWEFAFSSTPLFDVGNLLRFEERYPPGYVDGFRRGFEAAGGELPTGWRELSRGLDLFSLVDFLTREPGNPYRRKAVDILRRQINP